MRIRRELLRLFLELANEDSLVAFEIAHACRTSRQRASDLLHGRIARFNSETLIDILRRYGVTVDVVVRERRTYLRYEFRNPRPGWTPPPSGRRLPLDFERSRPDTLLDSKRKGPVPLRSRPPHPPEPDALRGSIDALILKALSLQPMHGWGIGLRIQQLSKGRLDVNQGSLYPALQRLEHRGFVESDWQTSDNNRRARYYAITPLGRKALGEEVDKWRRFVETVSLVLESR
jgi:transcriptional regulator